VISAVNLESQFDKGSSLQRFYTKNEKQKINCIIFLSFYIEFSPNIKGIQLQKQIVAKQPFGIK